MKLSAARFWEQKFWDLARETLRKNNTLRKTIKVKSEAIVALHLSYPYALLELW